MSTSNAGNQRGGTEILTRNPEMLKRLEMLPRIARTKDPVLIYGEPGTGKKLVARRTHELGRGLEAPFVIFKCCRLPKDLEEVRFCGLGLNALESDGLPGIFEEADGGTVVLEDVDLLRPGLQTQLERVLDRSVIQRVEGHRHIHVDVRIICTAEEHLGESVTAGRFQARLFHRLCVIILDLPPLRERREDIPLLLDHFLDQARETYKRPGLHFTRGAIDRLAQCPLHGNVLELRDLVERAALSATDDAVGPEELAALLEQEPRSAMWSALE